jgi:4-hydroxybenzoate polyprenyltransferase
MRVEIALVLIGSLWLFYNKTKSLFKTIVGTWLMYSIIFAYIALPALFSLIALRLGLEVAPGEVPVTKIFFVITVITTLWFVFKTNAERFMLIVRDIRPLRWTHFQFMFILGVCLSVYFGDVELAALASPGVLFDWVFVVMSITCAWIYSIIINNLEDIEIDSVSNPDRLTVTGAINPDMYSSISWWVLFGSISSAALVGFEHMFLVLAFIAGYFLYSAPPLRLKRVLILSKGIIALNSMLLVTAGYAFLNIKETFTLPTVLLPIFLVGFTMLLNFIDLKDYAGDKQAGIKTLPVVVGMEWAKWIIGTSFIATYLSVYSITQNIYLVPALLLVGLAQYYLVTKEVWEEWKVLTLHLAILVPAFVYLLVM